MLLAIFTWMICFLSVANFVRMLWGFHKENKRDSIPVVTEEFMAVGSRGIWMYSERCHNPYYYHTWDIVMSNDAGVMAAFHESGGDYKFDMPVNWVFL